MTDTTTITNLFTFVEATDWQVEDDSFQLTSNPAIGIQCCNTGGFIVSEWDAANGVLHYHDHGFFASLEDACAAALNWQRSCCQS
jgi:hypothetical protein